MRLLEQIKTLGYDVKVNEGNIKLLYKGEGVPDKNRVLPLLEELRGSKNDVIKMLQRDKALKPMPDETLRALFLETMNGINDSYISGAIKFVEEYHPDLDDEINRADDKINEIWEICNQGKAVIKEFKDALSSYEKLYLEAIDIFKSKSVNSQEKINI